MIEFYIEGRAAPKGSRNSARSKKTGRIYTYPASRFEQPWVEHVRDTTREHARHHGTLPEPYALELTFALPAPARKVKHQDWPTRHDVDKLARAVVDGLVKGGLLSDDRHLLELICRKRYVSDGEQPGVWVGARTLSEAQPVSELAA